MARRLVNAKPSIKVLLAVGRAILAHLTLHIRVDVSPLDARLLRAALPHPLAAALDRADVHACLAEGLA